MKRHPIYKDYFVTKEGIVLSDRKRTNPNSNKVMKQSINIHGYLTVRLSSDCGLKWLNVHRLVLETYKGPRPSLKHQARHLNGVRTDNRLANLKWGTGKENTADRIKHNLDRVAQGFPCLNKRISDTMIENYRSGKIKRKSGQDVFKAKFTNKKVKNIREELKLYSAAHLARKYKVSKTTMMLIKHNKTYKEAD